MSKRIDRSSKLPFRQEPPAPGQHAMSDKKSTESPPAETAGNDSAQLSRRGFLQIVGITGAVSGLGLSLEGQAAAAAAAPTAAASDGLVPVQMKINGKGQALRLDPRTTLLDALREHVQLTGTKKGCDHGQCGACTVHVNGRRVNACLSLAVMHEGDEVTTIEGLGQPDALHPMQQAFLEHDGYQCGYCTSGQIMSAVAMLEEPWGASDAEVKEAMSGNICRCGAYTNILAAIKQGRPA
jgi:xanthine dehydrogenase YagT iron-sulfur-binding subunit